MHYYGPWCTVFPYDTGVQIRPQPINAKDVLAGALCIEGTHRMASSTPMDFWIMQPESAMHFPRPTCWMLFLKRLLRTVQLEVFFFFFLINKHCIWNLFYFATIFSIKNTQVVPQVLETIHQQLSPTARDTFGPAIFYCKNSLALCHQKGGGQVVACKKPQQVDII